MTTPRSVYPPYTPRGNLMKRSLTKFSRAQRERFFLLVVRMVGQRIVKGQVPPQ